MAIIHIDNESDLLAKIALGDQRAFQVVYERYKKKIYTYSFGLLHSDILAEEVMQEVFLKIWCLGEGLKDIRDLDAFMKTVTRNRSLDFLRKAVSAKKADVELTKNYSEAHNETEEAILLQDTRRVLNNAIDLLPQQQREVYLLCQIEGLKYEEVAAKLNISTNTVKTHMKRALASLRQHVRSHTDIAALLILFKLI